MLTTALRSGRAWTLTAGAAAVVVAAALGAASASAKGTVWLCKPGASPDPCTPGLSTTATTPR
jgi:Spy/CpxP family protein refolding chaperone